MASISNEQGSNHLQLANKAIGLLRLVQTSPLLAISVNAERGVLAINKILNGERNTSAPLTSNSLHATSSSGGTTQPPSGLGDLDGISLSDLFWTEHLAHVGLADLEELQIPQCQTDSNVTNRLIANEPVASVWDDIFAFSGDLL